MSRPAIRVALLSLLVIPLAIATGAERRFDKKFTVKPGGVLKLHTDVGSVKIDGTSGGDVVVAAVIKGREREVEAFEITAEQTSAGVEIKGRTSNRNFWRNNDLSVEYTVAIPREYNVELQTAGGNVQISALTGSVTGQTSGGDIKLGAIDGKVHVETSGGNIWIEKGSGDLKAETSGGNIMVGSVKGNVRVETSGGNIKLSEVEGSVNAETSGGDVVVKVTGPNRGIHAETSGGNIDIQVAKNVGADIDAGTSGGEVICDLPVMVSGRIDESHVRGSVNGGGSKIYAHTSGGDVRIRAIP